jgi:hypothetical protein
VGLFDPQDVVMEQQNKKGSTNKIFDIDGKRLMQKLQESGRGWKTYLTRNDFVFEMKLS